MTISLGQARRDTIDILKAGLVPNLLGSPGVGKSDILRAVAKEWNLKIIDFRLSQSEPTDLNGFPSRTADGQRSFYAPPVSFPLSTDTIPEGYKGWLLFLDEITSAPLTVQAASYKLILDRAVGEQALHENVMIVAAGNLSTDKAITNRMGTAMQSRLVTLEVEPELQEWLDWAVPAGIHHIIRSYVEFRPELLHKFNPSHTELTFPCPRTWEFASKLFHVWGEVTQQHRAILSGTIGKVAAAELIQYCSIYQDLPTTKELINKPNSITLNTGKKDLLYALSGLISSVAADDTLEALMITINKLPIEMQVITFNSILRQDETLLVHPAAKGWVTTNAERLYGAIG